VSIRHPPSPTSLPGIKDKQLKDAILILMAIGLVAVAVRSVRRERHIKRIKEQDREWVRRRLEMKDDDEYCE